MQKRQNLQKKLTLPKNAIKVKKAKKSKIAKKVLFSPSSPRIQNFQKKIFPFFQKPKKSKKPELPIKSHFRIITLNLEISKKKNFFFKSQMSQKSQKILSLSHKSFCHPMSLKPFSHLFTFSRSWAKAFQPCFLNVIITAVCKVALINEISK